MKPSGKSIKFVLILIAVIGFGYGTKTSFAQTGPSAPYVPLIGISSVPVPLALPKGPGNVTYTYAVKNFIQEVPLTNIIVTDDHCSPVKFAGGDDNHDSKLDYNETWRYTCTTKVSQTTQSIATATGTANNITATHKAYTTVVVASNIIPPLVSIVNVTKVAYPLSLPAGGDNITYTYKVNNPGTVPLSNVTVTDDKCVAMSSHLGDTNGNNLLDPSEVWIYSCTTALTQTTTDTATVTAFANGLTAVDDAVFTVKVANPIPQSSANLFDVGISPVGVASPDLRIPVWIILAVILIALMTFFFIRKRPTTTSRQK